MRSGPVSKLDRLRRDLTSAEAKLRAHPGSEALDAATQRAQRLLADEERRALLSLNQFPKP
jgi:hypothetical protein